MIQLDSLSPARLYRAFFNFFFPYVSVSTVTQSYVWRQGLKHQRLLAQLFRGKELGHFYEFGVYNLSSITKFNFVRNFHARFDSTFKKVGIYAFDSFEGLPAPTTEDVRDPLWKRGDYSCSLDDVKRIAQKYKIKNIQYIKGYYENTLTDALAKELAANPPSLVHVDCDLYTSTITVLRWLDKIALPGAIYFFDDIWRYYGHPDHGELKAIREYNADTKTRGQLVEHPLGLGSKQVYCFCPRNPEESVAYAR